MGTYTGEVADLSLPVSYEDIYGMTKTLVLTNGELYNTKYGLFGSEYGGRAVVQG